MDCGKEINRWGGYYGHVMETTYTRIGNDISRKSVCKVCGENLIGDGNAKAFTLVLGENENVEFASIKDLNESYLQLKFVPSQTATYEFWSENYTEDPNIYVYDANYNQLCYQDDYNDLNFYLTSELIAGETYYIAIGRNYTTCDIYLNVLPKPQEVAFGAFGSGCGGTMTVETVRGEKRFTNFAPNCQSMYEKYVEEYGWFSCCTECGFGWCYADFARADENCQEIHYRGYYFLENANADEWTITNYLFEKKTGYISHTENTRLIEDLSGETTETDDNGNVITVRTQVRERFCEVCGKIFERSVNVVKCTADGMELYNEYAYYTPIEQDDGTYTYSLYAKRVYAYGTCKLDNDITRHYTLYTLSENYDENGNVTWFERNEYRYTDAYFCEGVRIHSGTNYQTREYIFVSHNETYYRVNNEETTGLDADGNETQIFVRTEENYCALCGKVTARWVYTDIINETKHTHEEIFERWSIETETGSTELVCRDWEQTVYGVTEVNGEAFEYRLSYYTEQLNGNGMTSWRKLEYTYADGSYCEGTVYITGSDYEGYTELFEYHGHTKSVYSLSEGSVTCEDGLDKKIICAICSAVIEESAKAYYSHEYNVESIKIGSCGSELLSYSCPCGERAAYDVNRACETFKQEDNVEICVDCGYGFCAEYGYKTDDTCQQIYYTTVTVYPSEGDATTYHAEWYTGEKQHSSAWKELIDESGREETTDDNGTVIGAVETYAQEYYCEKCFASFQKNVSVNTYDANGTRVSYEYRQYVSFAIDADDYGYRLSSKNVITYGSYDFKGKIYPYVLSESTYYYDETETCTSWNRSDYVYEGEDYCHATVIYTDQNNNRSEGEYQNHSHTAYTYALSNGSDSCSDGINRLEFCLMCGETTYIYYHYAATSYHEYYIYEPVEVIELSNYGAVCGGTAKVYVCPCGAGKKVDLDVNGMLEQSGGYKGHNEATGEFDIYEYTYVCAVTDPVTCEFTYTYRTWWTRSTTCEQIHHEQYVFGVDGNTYTVAWSYNTHNVNHYTLAENETRTTEKDGDYTVNVTKWDYICQYCDYHDYTYTYKSYLNADDSIAWYSEQYDYYYGQSNVRQRNYYAQQNVSTIFNGNTYSMSVRLATEYTYFDENGSVTSWEKYAYAYPETYCTEELTFTNSNCEENRYTNAHSHYGYWTYYVHSGWTKARSCTQYGVSKNTCVWCLDVDEETHSPYGHSYSSYNDGRYVCRYCGLENFTGADGVVELEDLTSHENYGDGENYVVGYQIKDAAFVYTLVIELIADGLEEPITLYNAALGDLNALTISNDGVSFVRFSMASVQELAAANGLNTCEYMVRVNFIPTDASTFDYAITLDSHYFETTTQAANACGSYATWKTCSFCGKVKDMRYVSCNWSASVSAEEIDGISYDVTTYTCEDCGLIFVQKVASVNCVQYQIDCWDQNGDGTFEVVCKTQSIAHSYYYTWVEAETIYTGCQCKQNVVSSVAVQSQTETITPVKENSWETQKYFTFTATQSGEYRFYSTRAEENGGDPYGYLYDSNGNNIARDDDSNDNLNFGFAVELTAGETYALLIERGCNCTVTIEYLGA